MSYGAKINEIFDTHCYKLKNENIAASQQVTLLCLQPTRLTAKLLSNGCQRTATPKKRVISQNFIDKCGSRSVLPQHGRGCSKHHALNVFKMRRLRVP